MYLICIHDYSQEKGDFFLYFLRILFQSLHTILVHVHVLILYTFICSHHAKKAHQRLKVYIRYVYV